MMNKLFTSLLVGVLFFVSNLAAQPTFTITPQNVTAQVNDVINFDVVVNDFTDIASMQFSINWDASVLTFGSISNINSADFTGLNINQFGSPPNLMDGNITITWFDDSFNGISVPNGTTLFSFSATAIADGTTNVEFGNAPTAIEIVDLSFSDIGLNPNNASVTIGDGGDGGGGGNDNDFNLILSDETTNVGDQVCVDVSVEGFMDILGMQFSINYDPADLEFVSVGNFNLTDLNANLFGTPPGTTAGNITLSWLDQSLAGIDLTDGTNIFEICFNALSGGTTEVSFSGSPTGIEISDTDGGIIPFNSESSTITINGDGGNGGNNDFELIISDETVNQGEEVCVDVSVESFTDIQGMQFSINYDPAMLSFVSVGNFNLTDLNANLFGTPPGTTAGNITLSWLDQSLSGVTLADGSNIFEICFDAIGTGSTNVSFSGSPTSIEVSDTNGDVIPFSSTAGNITIQGDGGGGDPDPPFMCPNNSDFYLSIANANVGVGEEVCVPVSVCNFTNILGAQFSINYNPSELEFVSFGAFNLTDLNANLFGTPPSTTAGNITLSWLDQSLNGVTLDDGTEIFEICFRGLAEGEATVSFSGAPTGIEISDTDGMIIPFNSNSGTITVGDGGGGDPDPPFTCPNNDDFYLSIADAQIEVGQQTCLEVSTCNFTDILGMQFSINYDPSELEFVSVGGFNLTDLNANLFGTPPGTSPGNITLSWLDQSLNGVTISENDPAIFEICFQGLVEGSHDICFSGTPTSIEISDVNGNIIPFNGDCGTVTVGEDVIQPGSDLVLDVSSATGDNGDQVCLDVSTANFNNITDLTFSLSYDPIVIEFASVGAFNLLGLNNGDFDTSTDGQIGFDWSSNTGVSVADNTDIFEVCFNILGDPGDQSDVNITGTPTPISATNSGGQDVTVDPRDGDISVNFDPNAFTLEIEDMDVDEGENFCLDVTSLNFTDILGMQFTITYDPDELAFQSVGAFGLPDLTVNNFGLPNGGGTVDGVITLTWFDNSLNGVDRNPTDVIFEICFQALGECGTITPVQFANAPTSIEISDVNSNVLPLQAINGNVAICAAMPIVISSADITDVECNGESNGAIDITVNGGSGCYNYQWDYQNSTSEDLSNIPSGTYNVTITDCTAGFSATASYVVDNPPPLFLNPMSSNPSCNGSSDGSIDLNIVGGTGAYTINWNGNLTDGLEVQNNLPAGFYSAIINDANGCLTQTGNIQLIDPDAINITLIPQPMSNGNPGAITSNVQNANGNISYSWTGPGGFSSSMPNLTGLTQMGEYCLTVTDGNGCMANSCTELSQALAIIDQDITRACLESSTGIIDITVAGGCQTTDYTFSWSGPNGFTANTEDISDLPPGEYLVTVTDCSPANVIGSFEVTTYTEVSFNPNPTLISGDPSNANGRFNCQPGQANSYEWEDGFVGNLRENLSTGEYCLTVTNNATGCQKDTCLFMYFPLSYDTDVSITNISCNGETDGVITFDVFGGIPPYTVTYNGESANTGGLVQIQGLAAGEYDIEVMDALGNIIEVGPNPVVEEPDAISINTTEINYVHDTEEPGCTGSISLDITGGTGAYSVTWNTPQMGTDINSLCAGCYTPEVTDENGCTTTLENCIDITQFAITGLEEPVNCPDDFNGAINLTVTGGDEPYEFEWSHGPNTEDVDGLAPGTYTVSVTEQSGNTLVREFMVAVGSSLTATAQVLSNFNGYEVSCATATDGRAQIVTTGAAGSVSYEWTLDGSLISVDQILQNAGPGEYVGTAIDNETGCTIDVTVVLLAPPPIEAIETIIDVACFGESNGEISVIGSGGAGGLAYSWSNGASGFRNSNLPAGNYDLTITDTSVGCSVTSSYIVNEPSILEVSVLTEANTDRDNCNGMASAVVTGGTPPYTYRWFGDPNLNTAMLVDICDGEYPLEVSDSRGCTLTQGLVLAVVENRTYPCLEASQVITPDGDGLNEIFIIGCIEEFKDNRLEIYNRWGQRVFEVEGYQNNWRGETLNGEDLPEGPYYYVLEYTDNSNQRQQLKGSLTLLREE